MLDNIFTSIKRLHSHIREVGKTHLRSPKWRTVRNNFLKENAVCACCGSDQDIQVHHVKPFHLYEELELDPTNLISLCMSKEECHLRVGHADSFKCYNPNVRIDAEKMKTLNEEGRSLLLVEIKEQRKLA
jgi:hypothetical protein